MGAIAKDYRKETRLRRHGKYIASRDGISGSRRLTADGRGDPRLLAARNPKLHALDFPHDE
jgi:hypothetical protein